MNPKVFLFPGQGSQYVGMGKDIHDLYPSAREIFEKAEEITALPLKELCFTGPMEDLTLTANLQPAVTTVNLAILACLEEKGIKPDWVAGHSLGEYSALFAARVISLEETIRLVKTRGALMDQAAQKNPGSMAAVMGLSSKILGEIISTLEKEGAIGAANFNTPEQTVISGTKSLIEKASQQVAQAGGKAIPLAVSGAWHSPLMAEALEGFKKVLDSVQFNGPVCGLVLNGTGKPENDPVKIKEIMGQQIGQPVRWTEAVNTLMSQGVSRFVEVGPKKVLLGLVRKCLPRDYTYQAYNVEDLKSLDTYLAAEKN
ncbi:MAG: ACP S-malonyltransferase [Deltaproteobacteria bacterium]|nr:ACP S-malonyltransferase [Deltaproteobacteria bacterium]